MTKQFSEIVHLNITIRGRVQGVGFRYSAEHQARSLGIKGFVKNLRNGDVYLEIEGNKLSTQLMLDWCNQGPGTSRVDQVFTSEGKIMSFSTFRIAY